MDLPTDKSNGDDINIDDVDMLRTVLMKVRGSFPNEPYNQANYFAEDEEADS